VVGSSWGWLLICCVTVRRHLLSNYPELMGELEDALAAKKAQDAARMLQEVAREREAQKRGAELAKEFLLAASRLGIRPDKVLEHVTFEYHEHPNSSSRYADRTRGKDISRVKVAECWDIYEYLLTTDGHRAVPTYARSETHRRLFGKPYSIGEEGWEMCLVSSDFHGYVGDNYRSLKEMMVEYIDRRSRA